MVALVKWTNAYQDIVSRWRQRFGGGRTQLRVKLAPYLVDAGGVAAIAAAVQGMFFPGHWWSA
jgi:hypothetical protein